MTSALVHRSRQLGLAAVGIALATALIGTICVFATSSGESMTRRAVAHVPLAWQIAIATGADPAALMQTLRIVPGLRAAETIGYADVAGFETTTGGTLQTTGRGQVLGISSSYATTFPGQIRVLLGSAQGTLIAQQTAANLHVTVGDRVSMLREGQPPTEIVIDGVVELPNADALFQTIAPQKGPAAVAPPDNVLVLPIARWNELFAGATRTQSGGARYQIHAGLDPESLPAAPDAAYIDVNGRARNFEVRAAGAAQVADNLAARLGAVRQDALFARVLLLFLGLPGVVLAALLTIAVVGTDADRRRRERALLSLRGASPGQIARLILVEGGLVALVGASVGTMLAALLAAVILGANPGSPVMLGWLAAAFGVSLVLGLAATLLPALADQDASVASRRALLASAHTPLWQRVHADLILLAIAGAVYWREAGSGYQVVLAPEGVAAVSVDYAAFLAPLCLWIGATLLIVRLGAAALGRGRAWLAAALRPMGSLADPIAASLSRQNHRLAGGVGLATLAFSFATATAVFNATYNAQALVDARLTNGADVTVTGTMSAPAGDRLADIRRQSGVIAAEPMQHRYAYVGSDLQDLYGIDAGGIGRATEIADAYFAGSDARATLARLAATDDGLLLSQETANDFQLKPGDTVNLRMQHAADHQYRVVPFHFVGVVMEFPTAPRDSFLVANATYVAAQTGTATAETVLIRAGGDPGALAGRIRAQLGPASSLRVTDLSEASRVIGSSLTAVDLRALTTLELGFAVLLVAGATGLVLWLGLAERRRNSAILSLLGASATTVRRFAEVEAAIIIIAGGCLGLLLGEAVALLLVKLLTGVFDPPPDALAQPLWYLAATLVGALLATGLAVRHGASADDRVNLARLI